MWSASSCNDEYDERMELMKSIFFETVEAAANKRKSAMETRDHFKNGASLKSHMSKGNFFELL